MPPAPEVVEAIKAAAAESLRLYPSATAAPARRAIAEHFGLEVAQVAIGNGGDELIELCFRAFVDAGDKVAYPTPTYPLFDPLCQIHQVVASRHPLSMRWVFTDAFAKDPAPLKFLVNPNSPTGTWAPKDAVESVVARSSGVVALDEAYVDFAPESRLDLLATHPNLIILRTFSKSYALAGMRIGFALGHPDLIGALDMVKDSYNVDRLAVVAATAAIRADAYHRALVGSVVSERGWLAEQLAGLGFEVSPSAANFVFVKPPTRSAASVHDALRERKILVRVYDREPIAGWFRITVGTREQHDRLLAAFKEIF